MAVADAHRRLSCSADLLRRRRGVYRAAIEVLVPSAGTVDDDRLDDPLLRGAVRDACSGARPLEPETVLGSAYRCPGPFLEAAGRAIPVVADAGANERLADVLRIVRAGSTTFLTESQPARFARACALLRAGAELARTLSPSLTADLMPHVGLLGILQHHGAADDAVQSASLREFPGLLLVMEPRTPMEAAEMLLHEAAHSRFFDMLIVHEILPLGCDALAPFDPSWHAAGTRWPIEQAMAALHAYAVLAEFARDVTSARRDMKVSPTSLLPRAADRVAEIGAWILQRIGSLGVDAPTLVGGLLEVDPPDVESPRRPIVPGMAEMPVVSIDPRLSLDYADNSDYGVAAIVGVRSQLYVLGRDSGLVLRVLMRAEPAGGLAAAVEAFALRHRELSRDQAEAAVSEIVMALAGSALLTVTPRAAQEP